MTTLRWCFLGTIVAMTLSLLTCGPMHTGPSEGVVLYEHPDYKGDSIGFSSDASDLEDFEGPCFRGLVNQGWDKCVSSVRVTEGWEGVLYDRDHYEGNTLIVTSDIPDLDDVNGPCGGDWDDCVSSLRVSRQ